MTQIKNKNSPPREIVGQIVNLLNNGNLLKADELSNNLIKQYPDSYVVWNILGEVNKFHGK